MEKKALVLNLAAFAVLAGGFASVNAAVGHNIAVQQAQEAKVALQAQQAQDTRYTVEPVAEVTPKPEIVGNPDPTATCAGASKISNGCSPEQDQANKDAYWAEQNRREAEMRADCRAGRINRDTCNQLVWDWETRI